MKDNRRCGGGEGDGRVWNEAAETMNGRRRSLLSAVGSGIAVASVNTAGAAEKKRRSDGAATRVSDDDVATSGESRSDVVDDRDDASRCRLEVCSMH